MIAAFAVVALIAQDFSEVRALIEREMAAQKIPSIAVAVAKDGKIVWEQGFGLADRESRRKADAHTLYSLASISKPITATGLMVLADRGRIDLDAPVNKYLGPAQIRAHVGDANQATVRRVLNHTSGLPQHWHFFYAGGPAPPPREQTIASYGWLFTPPGERYEYSNLGYGILDHVITGVSGKGYWDYMREEVFQPLGLTHTSVGVPDSLKRFAATRYSGDQPLLWYDFDHPGASAIWSSAHDLVRFGMFHLKTHLADQKPILRDETIDAMQAGEGYALGWGIDVREGQRMISHGGGMPGVSTTLRLYPGTRRVDVVLANTSTPLVNRIADALVGFQPGKPLPVKPPDPGFAAKVKGQWIGTVESADQTSTIELAIGDEVELRLGDKPPAVARPRLEGNRLSASFAGSRLSLTLRGGVLNGAMNVYQANVSSLASWVALERVQTGTFRIKPVRPVEELRKSALAAKPPEEKGDFLPADLVEVVKLAPSIKLDVRYATANNFLGSKMYTQARAFLQRPTAEALVRANQKLAAQGYGLLIHDAYRPWYVTKIFRDATPLDKHNFVADPAKGSKHNRGCAVDLTLYDLKTGKPMKMPSTYDEFSPRAHPTYTGGSAEERANRDLLRRTMESEGFTVDPGEWWHFDYKDWRKYRIGNVPFEKLP